MQHLWRRLRQAVPNLSCIAVPLAAMHRALREDK